MISPQITRVWFQSSPHCLDPVQEDNLVSVSIQWKSMRSSVVLEPTDFHCTVFYCTVFQRKSYKFGTTWGWEWWQIHYQLNFPFKNTLIWSSGLVSTGGFIFLHTASRLLWTEKPSPHTQFVSSNVCTQCTTKLKTSGICLGLTHCAFLNQSSSQLRKGKSQIHSPSYDKPISCTSQQSLNNRKAHCRVRL